MRPLAKLFISVILERSEGSQAPENTRFFATLRMTRWVLVEFCKRLICEIDKRNWESVRKARSCHFPALQLLKIFDLWLWGGRGGCEACPFLWGKSGRRSAVSKKKDEGFSKGGYFVQFSRGRLGRITGVGGMVCWIWTINGILSSFLCFICCRRPAIVKLFQHCEVNFFF